MSRDVDTAARLEACAALRALARVSFISLDNATLRAPKRPRLIAVPARVAAAPAATFTALFATRTRFRARLASRVRETSLAVLRAVFAAFLPTLRTPRAVAPRCLRASATCFELFVAMRPPPTCVFADNSSAATALVRRRSPAKQPNHASHQRATQSRRDEARQRLPSGGGSNAHSGTSSPRSFSSPSVCPWDQPLRRSSPTSCTVTPSRSSS
jgi:hypothetical protein